MEIRPISDDVRSALRSGLNLLTIPQSINELIYNSIDAETKCIEIRVDLSAFTFQVIDDGNGITKTNLISIGTRYRSSKCYSLSDYTNNSKYYGFRGETLCNLINICKSVTIHTRPINSDKTYRKCFVNGIDLNNLEMDSVTRPSHGTTILVNGWMQNLPVRQKQMNPIFDMVEIKNQIEKIALIHPNISFMLRNNSSKRMMLSIHHRHNILNSINVIFGKGITDNLKYLNFDHKDVKITGYVDVKAIAKCDIQLIYLNRRFIKRSRIHKYLRLMYKNLIYFLHFECPYSEFEILPKEYGIKIDFKYPHKILKFMEIAVTKLLIDEGVININDKKSLNFTNPNENCSRLGITQFDSILKSKVATKSSENLLEIANKPILLSEDDNRDEQSKVSIKLGNNFEKLKTDHQQFFENLNLSQGIHENASLVDDIIFKTPTVPPLRRKVKNSNILDCVRSPNSIKTYNSHTKRFLGNQIKTKKLYPEYTANNSIGLITPLTKVNNWLNNLKQDTHVGLVGNEEKGQIEIKPKKIIQKRRRSFDICQTENSDNSIKIPNKVDILRHENLNQHVQFENMNNSRITKVSNKRLRLNDSDDSLENAKFYNIHNNSFEIPFKLNTSKDEINGSERFSNIDDKSEIKIITPKPISKDEINCSERFSNIDDKSEIEIITPKPISFCRQVNKNISITQSNIKTAIPVTCQEQHTFKNHNNAIIDLTSINCNQIMDIKKLGENPARNLTSYSTGISKLFDSTNDSSKFIIPQSIMNNYSSIKPTSVTIASKSDSNYFQIIPFEKNIKKKCENSFILNKYFNQYDANNNMVMEDVLSDVNETKFENGLNNIVTSTAKVCNSEKESEAKFQLIKRLDIIPKGMSQIYDNTDKCICRHLSPQIRNQLMAKIKRTYEDKLNFDSDLESYGRIFDDKFAIRQQIQISMTKNSKIYRSYLFSKNVFNKLKILKQVDKKFIATFLEPTFTENGMLILFDQHAVHERIRLEKLLKDYEKLPGVSKASKLDEILTFNLESYKIEIMENCRINFENHGFVYTIMNDSIHVTSIPMCIFNKSCREKNSKQNNLMATLTMALINELIEFSLETNGLTNFFPYTILTIINSEACRGATKFGDELSINECELYIKQLSNCSLPFQCAHGRPTLVPIFELVPINKIYDSIKINFQNIIKSSS